MHGCVFTSSNSNAELLQERETYRRKADESESRIGTRVVRIMQRWSDLHRFGETCTEIVRIIQSKLGRRTGTKCTGLRARALKYGVRAGGLVQVGDIVFFQRRQPTLVWVCLLLIIVSAVCGAATDLSFHALGYTWQVFNCFFTAAYSVRAAPWDTAACGHVVLRVGQGFGLDGGGLWTMRLTSVERAPERR